MKKYCLVSFLIAMSTNVYAALPEKTTAIDKMLSDWNHSSSPGAVVGVIHDHKLVFSKGYGMANLEYSLPNNAKSIFRIGSTSKQFTAASIILLEQQGKLSLNDSITQYFPEFPEYANHITIQHLLNHTSGIRDYLTLSYLSGLTENDVFTNKQIINWLVSQKTTDINPGSQFRYSNSGYWLLGQVVEKVAGMSLAEYAKKEIFSPLGMHNTHFHDNHKHIVKNRASGYRMIDHNQYEISMTSLNMIGDGGVYTNLEDLKKWDDAFYKSNKFNDAFWQKMLNKGTFNDGRQSNYASGLLLGQHRGLQTIGHGGAFVGYRAELLRYPEEKFSVIVLSNRADANATGLAYDIATLYLENKLTPIEPIAPAIARKDTPDINIPKHELQQFVGKYWDENAQQAYTVLFENDTLMLNAWGGTYNLKAITDKSFYVSGIAARVTLTFGQNSKGKRTNTIKVENESPNTAVEFKQVSYSNEQYLALSGKYYSEELDTIYELVTEDNKLILNITDKVISPLEVVYENTMTSRHEHTLTFKQSKPNNILGFNLAARGVKNIWFKKIETNF